MDKDVEWEIEKWQQQKEIEKKDKEIATLKRKIDSMVNMVPSILECRPPPRVYYMYLKEHFLTFKISSILLDRDHSLEMAQ